MESYEHGRPQVLAGMAGIRQTALIPSGCLDDEWLMVLVPAAATSIVTL